MNDLFAIYRGKRVLITGHTGFKGSWLSLWLGQLGAEQYGIALDPHTSPNLFAEAEIDTDIADSRCDIRKYDELRARIDRVEPEIIFHLAAQPLVRSSYEMARETFDTNVMGSINVFQAARDTKSVKALVHVSTDKCYKESGETKAYIEEDELGGHDPYSSSKAAAEMAFHSYNVSFFDGDRRLGAASGRAGNVIGGGDWAAARLVPDAARAWQSGSSLRVRNSDAVRPWQHVLEALSGYLALGALLLEGKATAVGAWNFGPEHDNVHTVKDVVETMADMWPGATWEAATEADAPHEAAYLNLSCGKAKTELGWQPKWGFTDTVKRTVDWYKAYYDGQAARDLCMRDIDAYME